MKNQISFCLLIAVFILFSLNTSYCQYSGGDGNGHNKSKVIQMTLNGGQINSLVLYRGGFGDGIFKNSYSGNLIGIEFDFLFSGGDGDGIYKNSFSGTISGENFDNLYTGGDGDGFHKSSKQLTLDGSNLAILFGGGTSDGFFKSTYGGLLDGQEIVGLYNGGDGDGVDKLNQTMSLDGIEISIMFEGGENDGFAKESLTGLLDGGNLASLYNGGNSDGFSKNDVQYIWTSPSCTFVVNTDDSGFGSLRYAINCAEFGDTIHFSPLLHDVSIQLTTGPIFMFQNLYVDADPSANLTVDGSYLPFTLATGLDGFSEITIKGLNVMSGSDLFGNAIVNGGILILEDLQITDFTSASESLILTFPGSNLTIKGTVRLKLNY